MPEGASRTAEIVCFFRAMETHRAPAARILEDPYAEVFLGEPWRTFARSPWSRVVIAPDHPPRGARPPLPTLWPTMQAAMLQGFVAARHREIDDHLRRFLADGGDQVVVLGAGYDTRALRFADALGGRVLIEVDFPATQARKQALMRQRLPEATRHVAAYLGVDFLHEVLGEALTRPPFRTGARTFFIWEGVAMYLTESAVAHTLSTLAAIAGPGTEVVCDMWAEPRGRGLWDTTRRWGAGLLARIGEPLLFSLAPADAPAFFARHGWRVKDLADGRALGARWGRPIFPDNSVIHAIKQ
ncbi:MAG: class I SAM-dependent methyltransferase [Deltaproteobacteria bacterium]|nr:class I SAM-dependent methyltransferase [Deltaproteobacteria bacterium]